jgi:hypothetical protein
MVWVAAALLIRHHLKRKEADEALTTRLLLHRGTGIN